jgi:hypothetical protein
MAATCQSPEKVFHVKQPDRGNLSRAAFLSHRSHAKASGIEFRLTYDEWLTWWETELAKLGPRAKRGCKRRNFGMCRFLDRGPYAIGNVYIGRPKQNAKERWAAALYSAGCRITRMFDITAAQGSEP